MNQNILEYILVKEEDLQEGFTTHDEPPTAKRKRTSKGSAVKQSGVRGVSWDDTSQTWRAQWKDTAGKYHGKSFRVAKYGEDEAIRRAVESRAQMELEGNVRCVQRRRKNMPGTLDASTVLSRTSTIETKSTTQEDPRLYPS
jgi:N-acetylmuramoyl-L-alanine amidase CwlA